MDWSDIVWELASETGYWRKDRRDVRFNTVPGC